MVEVNVSHDTATFPGDPAMCQDVYEHFPASLPVSTEFIEVKEKESLSI